MRYLYIILVLAFCLSCKQSVKEPSVAGAFYPADRAELQSTVKSFLDNATGKDVDGRLIAVISPHAGYIYSGQVAAYSYKNLKDASTVILIGGAHKAAYKGASVYARGSWRTPLGDVPIDEKLAGMLLSDQDDVVFYPEAFEGEHSLEVQLPFLQSVLAKGFKIVPILISNPTKQMYDRLAGLLTEILAKDKRAVIVTSTDLSHYFDYESAKIKDAATIDAVETLSTRKLEDLLRSREGEMCGGFGVMLTLDVSRRLGANAGVLYKYANSGDVTGDKSSVVGYAALGLYKTSLTEAERKELLSLAKMAISKRVREGKPLDYSTHNPKFIADGAAFVTINRMGKLRGCIGNVVPVMPLYQSVAMNAYYASSNDPRFVPMTPDELDDMQIEVSILSPLIPVTDISEIQVGRDGLYIVKDGRTGILLPQVAPEQGWDRDTFLSMICKKAGLPEDAWKSGAELYRFEAEIIR